MVIFD